MFPKTRWLNGQKPDPTVFSEVLQLPGKSDPAGIQDAKNGKLVDDCRPWDFSIANVGFAFIFLGHYASPASSRRLSCHFSLWSFSFSPMDC